MLGTPFKQRAHYVFNYKPRYYSDRKERLENLKNKYDSKDSKTPTDYNITLSKNNLKNDWANPKAVVRIRIPAYVWQLS